MRNIDKFFALLWLPLLVIIYWRVPPFPADFALKSSGMFHDRIDTFSGKYSRPGIMRPERIRMVDGKPMTQMIVADSTVSFNFTRSEKQEIYSLLQQMNYTYYPADVSAHCKHQIVPSHKVQLTIRANNKLKYISYEDGCQDENRQSRELRKLSELLYEISHRHSEVRQLPNSMMFDM